MSQADFLAKAAALDPAVIRALVAEAKPKEFSTGSIGWRTDKSEMVKVGDCTVKAQIGFQAIIKGSKPEDASSAGARARSRSRSPARNLATASRGKDSDDEPLA